MVGNIYVYVLQNIYNSEAEYKKAHKTTHALDFKRAINKGICPIITLHKTEFYFTKDYVDNIHDEIEKIIPIIFEPDPYNDDQVLELNIMYRFVTKKWEISEYKNITSLSGKCMI